MTAHAFSAVETLSVPTKARLQREMDLACNAVRQVHIDAIMLLGVDASAIASLGSKQQPFGVASIAAQTDRQFSFFAGGQSRVIMPVMEGGEIVDLIAWETLNPRKWLWRIGAGHYLGRDLIARSQWASHHALKLVSTPLDWLRTGGDAVCILNWTAPRSELELIRFVDEIVVTDASLGQHVAKLMATPRPIPRITVVRG